MRTFKLIAIIIVMILAGQMQAQVSVNVNIGRPPMWGPIGYSDVHYYYLPDLEAYYDIPSSRFIYYEGNSWVHRKYLPARYRGYDLYNGYKVVMTNYRGKTPYIYFNDHKSKYSKGYRGKLQKTIGQKPGKGNYGGKNTSAKASNKKSYQGNSKIKKQGNGGGKGKR